MLNEFVCFSVNADAHYSYFILPAWIVLNHADIVRHRLLAWWTPGGPEVNQHHSSSCVADFRQLFCLSILEGLALVVEVRDLARDSLELSELRVYKQDFSLSKLVLGFVVLQSLVSHVVDQYRGIDGPENRNKHTQEHFEVEAYVECIWKLETPRSILRLHLAKLLDCAINAKQLS